MPHPPVTLAVLAGGASRRMGQDKPSLQIAGRTMLDHVLAAAGDLPTLVVGRAHPTSAWVLDPDPGRGPLAGLVTALGAVPGPVVLVGADQPWLQPATVHHLATATGGFAAAPIDGSHRQVLCAWYPAEALTPAREVLARGGGLQTLLDLGCHTIPEPEWRGWGEDGRSWFSVNTGAGLESGLVRYGPP